MKPRLWAMLLLSALLCALPVLGQGAQPQWTPEEEAFMAAHPEIRLGVDPKFIPYEFIDSDGTYKGIAADYLRLISQRTGLRFTVAPGLTWSEAYEKAVEGELDALPCVSRTPERERYFLYTEPYYSFIRVMVMNDTTHGIDTFEDLTGKTVAVQSNSSHHSYLKDFPQIALSEYRTAEEALAAVAEGRETVFVGNFATSLYQIRTNGFTNLKYVKFDMETRQNLHFAVRRDWPELVSILNKSLASLTEEERIAVDNHWIGVENRTDYSRILRLLGIVGAVLLGIFAVSSFWIIRLKREIAQRIQAEEAMLAAKEEAETANRIKSSFLARMSHEIRTPLNAITGMAYLIKKTEATNTQRLYVDKIVQASRNMLGIINDILDFSKIEAGKIEIEQVSFNLDKVLQQVISIISFKVDEQGIDFAMDRDPDMPCNLYGDPTRVEQVLLNLLSNAVKFTEKGRVALDIRAVSQGEEDLVLRFRVSDTGIGMTAEQLTHLYEPFAQADSSITRRFGGTGLGMPIVKHLVELMGGALEAESAPGRGTVFQVDLPFRIDTAQELAEKEKATSIYFREIRTLVLESSETYQHLLKRILKSFNMDSVFTRSEAEALALLTTGGAEGGRPFDLLILDHDTPGEGSLTFIARLRQNPAVSAVPKTILLLPLMREELFDQLEAYGVDLGITKPLIPSVLYNGIIELFRSSILEAHQEAGFSEQALKFQVEHPAHVLVVEDNRTNQFIAKSILEQAGFRVSLADNGALAVAFFEQSGGDVDVVLMDLHMPVMNGYDAAAAIRAKNVSVPIIAMTADAIAGVEEGCREAGMTGYISKPFEPEAFLAVLLDLLRQKRQGPPAPAPAAPTAAAPGEAVLRPAEGLRMLGGNPALYRMVLQEYQAENRGASEALRRCAAAGAFEEAAQVVHKLKSSTGSIGAKALAETASALQNAFQSGDTARIGELMPVFEQRMARLSGEIEDYLASDGE